MIIKIKVTQTREEGPNIKRHLTITTSLIFYLCSSGLAFNETGTVYADLSEPRSKPRRNHIFYTPHEPQFNHTAHGFFEFASEEQRSGKSARRFYRYIRSGFERILRKDAHDFRASDSDGGRKVHIVEVTAYNVGDPDQNWGDPCQSANGENICAALAAGLKRCAANFVPFGTKLHIAGYGVCTVTDRMNRRYKYRVDIAMEKHEKIRAIRFGLKRLLITILGREDG